MLREELHVMIFILFNNTPGAPNGIFQYSICLHGRLPKSFEIFSPVMLFALQSFFQTLFSKIFV